MPATYDTQDIPLVAEPLGGGVVIGYVIDEERGYVYVRKADLTTWGKSVSQLRNQGIGNLDLASSGLELHVGEGSDKWIGVEVKDGYDAARILLPGLRKVAVDRLGEPFFAGISNRDFLIMWSESSSQRFQDFTREKLRKDFQAQPYPLTPSVLKVTRDAIQFIE